MKFVVLASSLFAALPSFVATAAADPAPREQYLSECQRYASEDGIPDEELAAYLDLCVKDLAEADAQAAEEGETESPRNE